MGSPRNYGKELDKIIGRIQEAAAPPRLLLHSCCAPCSSYVMEYLREYFDLTVFYYNPNITEDEEYRHRLQEQKRLIRAFNRQAETERIPGGAAAPLIRVIDGDYEPALFFAAVKGLEDCPEGGERCLRCYRLRLERTARVAAEEGFDYFTTSLTISPMKNAARLNEIGEALGEKYGVPFLPSDFKKKNGYKRSIELSQKFGLYRQNYCGCVYSRRDAGRREDREKNG